MIPYVYIVVFVPPFRQLQAQIWNSPLSRFHVLASGSSCLAHPLVTEKARGEGKVQDQDQRRAAQAAFRGATDVWLDPGGMGRWTPGLTLAGGCLKVVK